nr:uncharacterized protein LOC107280394 isoform X1 [Oryza sativa Japonica Group]
MVSWAPRRRRDVATVAGSLDPLAGSHIFHILCLEQWLEYCPREENKFTHHLPHLQVAVWRRPHPTCLFFQVTGACRAPHRSAPPTRHGGRSPMRGPGPTRKSSSPRLTGWSRRPPPSTGCSTSSTIGSRNSTLWRAVAMWREKAWQPRNCG